MFIIGRKYTCTKDGIAGFTKGQDYLAICDDQLINDMEEYCDVSTIGDSFVKSTSWYVSN